MGNLESFGVEELNLQEIKETKGGGPIADFVHYVVHLDWSMENYGKRIYETGSPGGAK